MEIQRSINAKRNIVYGIINKVITLFLPFLLRTVIIKTIGVDYLGLNSLFSSILQVLNLTELGFSSAIVYSMYKPIAENDIDTVCALVNLFKKIYRAIGFFILVVGLLILPLLSHMINGSVPYGINIYLVYLIYLINTIATYWLFSYKTSIPNAMQRNDLISIVQTLTQGTMYFIQIIVLFCFENYYLYLILMPIFTLINNLFLSYIVDRKYPFIKCAGVVSKDKKKEIKTKVIGLFINKLCQTTRNSFDSIFVSAFLGLRINAMYNNYYYIISALLGLSSIITNSLTAGVGNSIILESKEKNYTDLRKINFIYMWMAGWSAICLLCLYQPFMKIWVGVNYLFPYDIIVVFTLYFYALKMGDMRGLYSDAAGLWWENRYRAIFEALVNILLNCLLIQICGVFGVVVSTLISLLIINFGLGSQIVFKYYFKNNKLKEYFKDHLIYFFISFFIALITLFLCILVKGNDWFVLSIRILICIFVPNILYLLLYRGTTRYRSAIPWLLCKIEG